MRLVIAAIAVSMTGACASLGLTPMKSAAVADNISTVLAESQGFAEINPLGFPATVVIKAAVIKYSEQLPPKDQSFVERVSVSVWGGAAVNNISLVLGASTVMAPLLGSLAAVYLWSRDVD